MRSNTRGSLCSSTGTPSTESNLNIEFISIDYANSTFLAEALPSVPKGSAVYKIFDTRGQLIVLDKTSNLFQRLERYFGERSERVKDLDLREITSRIEFRRTWSPFETAYVLYLQRRHYFPKTYRRMRTFRLFTLMKVNRKQRFPRIYASKQIKAGVEYFGPFVTRGQFARLKTALERTFKLRPCLYNIRGNDPHPDCLYFQMHTCSRPCNNDIGREGYLADVDGAIAFIQGQDEKLEAPMLARMNALAAEEKFEEAELVRRQLEKIQRARKEVKDKVPSIWGFDYLVLLPSDSTARTRVAIVRAGNIIGFEDFDSSSLADFLPDEVSRRFSTPSAPVNHNWQYDEFCLVANYLVHPLKSVDLVRVESGMDLAGYLRKRHASSRQKPREENSGKQKNN
jgi:excinuclease UvrABC nuclease subunit